MGWGSVIDLSSKRALCVRRVAEVRMDVGSGVIGEVEGGCHDKCFPNSLMSKSGIFKM